MTVFVPHALPSAPGRARFTLRADPRLWHLPALVLLLAYGVTVLDFDQPPIGIALLIAATLGTQWLCGRAVGLERFDPLSALATALSLAILLRASSPAVLMFAGSLSIAQKFVIRVDGKHVFNPSNFGIAVLLLFTDAAWISPAQWGSRALAAFCFASIAGLVLSRAKRADIALAFLAAYAAILFGRAFYLGDPLAIPLKQMQSGALLLFAFFMITDPKTGTGPPRRPHFLRWPRGRHCSVAAIRRIQPQRTDVRAVFRLAARAAFGPALAARLPLRMDETLSSIEEEECGVFNCATALRAT